MTHKFEALLYAILFTFWSVRLYYKLYDKKIRNYILSIGILIVFWMLIRMTKGVVETALLKRISWYLYYIPLIFIPAIYYICSNSLLNRMNNKRKIIIYGISLILFLLVITNDYHEMVFKFRAGIDDFDNYKHNIGYYVISLWIFYLFGGGMIKLFINRWKIKKDIKAFLPFLVLFMGIVYTCLYVLDINYIRDINMSVVNSVLICLGVELAFYLDLIPNNRRYVKTLENSNLDVVIVSLDGKTRYVTKKFREIPDKILYDIGKENVEDNYRDGYVVDSIKKNDDSYVIIRNDYRELYRLKEEIENRQEQLLELQESIKIEDKVKRELYEINLRKEVVSRIEKKLDDKRNEAKSILKKKNISDKDLEKIRRIIIYSKKKSAIMISELNNEMYNEEGIKLLINELITSMNSLKIDGIVVVKNKISINSGMMSILYDIVYDVIDNIYDKSLIIYIDRYKNNIKVNINIGDRVRIKNKLKLDERVKVREKVYDTDTELIFSIKDSDVR